MAECYGKSVRYPVYLLLAISYKMVNFVFFAIAGALLLPKKEEPVSVIWKKRIFKIFMSLLFFSLVYYLCAVKSGTVSLGILPFLKGFLEEGWAIPLWYLYAYISFLICLPFLRSMVQNLKDRDFIYFFVLVAMFDIIKPVFLAAVFNNNHYLNGNLNISWLSEVIVLYPCMGYYIHNRLTKKQVEKTVIPLWIICFITLGITWLLNLRTEGVRPVISADDGYHGCLVTLFCFTIFVTARYLEGKMHGKEIPGKRLLQKCMLSLGSCTFGIYLWHIFFIDKLSFLKRWKVIFFDRLTWMDEMVTALIWCLVILLLSYGTTWIMKKIPLLKNLV